LLVISVCLFGMSKCTPVHPVEQYLDQQYTENSTPTAQQYQQAATLLGYDLPAFYAEVIPASYPDTLYRVFPIAHRKQLEALIDQTADAQITHTWITATQAAFATASAQPDSLVNQETKYLLSDLTRQSQVTEIRLILEKLEQQPTDYQLFTPQLASAFVQLTSAHGGKSLWQQRPRFVWHGAQNQYHKWLVGILRGDFGMSSKYRLPVGHILRIRLQRSATLGFVSVCFAFGIAIPLAVLSAGRNQKPIEQSRSARFSLFIYAIPVFWLGSILILFFATPFAGLKIFRYDCSSASSASLVSWLSESWSCLVLPVLCLSIHIGAVLFLQMRTAMSSTLQKEFIRTARLKGLNPGKVTWRHAFPVAFFQIIPVLGGLFAYMVAGSLVIEYLFNIKGMGAELVEAHSFRDYPVLFAILMLYSVALVIGNLLSDLLAAWLDPKINF
jgi:peptide/nickel transport system permease protein